MSSGLVAATTVAAATWTTVYTVPSGAIGTYILNVLNRNSTQAKVRVGITSAASPLDAELIEYDAPLGGYGTPSNVLERTGLVVQENYKVMIYSDLSNISAQLWGYEE